MLGGIAADSLVLQLPEGKDYIENAQFAGSYLSIIFYIFSL
ncbi:MAG: hypothetical protein CM1200mP30_28360 [Pseudomonadota bacterium]|nr:MAG: hypothetical protein CM1200mP30_28360 [Pseudomonadota bacterium]